MRPPLVSPRRIGVLVARTIDCVILSAGREGEVNAALVGAAMAAADNAVALFAGTRSGLERQEDS